jgi:hypothetical protein
MSEIRKITITGGASVFSVAGDEESKGRRQTAKRRQPAAAALPRTIQKITVGVETPVATAAAPNPNPAPKSQLGGGSAAASAAAPAVQPEIKTIKVEVEETVPQAVPAQQPSKVVLGGKKPKHLRVVLTKKNHDKVTASAPSSDSPAAKPRKVTLGLQHLKRRVTKARRLQRFTKTVPLENIKAELIAAKIIKPESKAPESILRQMYSDAKLVSTKSL